MAQSSRLQGQEDAVSAVVGVVLMVAITVVVASVVYVIASGLTSKTRDDAPALTVTVTPDTTNGGWFVTVTGWTGPTNTAWSAMSGVGTANCNIGISSLPGSVSVGDQIDCTGSAANPGETLIIAYKPTNTALVKYTFN